MKKIVIFVVASFLFFFSFNLKAFDLDIYGRIGGLKVYHPEYEDVKWGLELDLGGTLGITNLLSVDVRGGYGYVQVKNPHINANTQTVEWKYYKTIPFVVSLELTPLKFLPIINPYFIAGLGTWKIMDETRSTKQSFGGNVGVGIEFKGGCIGFDVRFLYELPDFSSHYRDYYISIAPVLFLGF